jgi:Flp pilus assembly protein TadG
MRRLVPNCPLGMSAQLRRSRKSKRRGLEYLELVLVMPILFMTTIAIFQFGILMLYHTAVTSAAVEGAREFAKPGATPDNVSIYIQNFLAIHGVSFNTTTTTAGSGDAYVRLETSDTSTTTTTERGNVDLAVNAVGPNSFYANEVRVTVCSKLVAAKDRPVPNWLKYIGLDLSARHIRVSSSTLRE